MRLIELGQIAAQAEALRWRRYGRRQVSRGVVAAIGAVFAIAVLVCLHVAAALALVPLVGALYGTLIVGAVDLVIAGICLVIASRDQPDAIEREALAVRQQATAQMGQAALMSAMVLPMLRRGGFAMAHRLLGGRRKP